MDLGAVIGLPAGVVCLVIGIMLTGALSQYIDGPSFLIVLGCSFATFLMANPMRLLKAAPKILVLFTSSYNVSADDIINQFVAFATKARKDGLLALESDIEEIKDPFMKKGLQLVVDGTDPALIRSIMETELASMEGRHSSGIRIFVNIATLAPAFGMIGTLIGLINMLAHMEDPEMIGPSMSVALITTMYGSILANLFMNPISYKLANRSAEEVAMKELMLEGMLSIQSGDNPRIVEERLRAFLAPSEQAERERREEK
jgi:chemotaxis protein MotA